jgi:signal transduction histidine kinase
MNVRTKFTLLISFASLITVVFFSSYLYSVVKEEIYEVIDFELADAAESIYTQLETASENDTLSVLEFPGFLLKNYWLHVYTESGRTLLATKLVQYADIPAAESNRPYFVTLPISHEYMNIPGSEKDEITNKDPVELRARMFSRQLSGEKVIVHIAKPILLLNTELHEILLEMIWGIFLAILLMIGTSYFVAGRLLAPLSTLNRKIVAIREHSLHERIPLGKNRDELYTLSSSLNSMFDRLEHSFRRQRDFIGNAAHEMKSPLTILMLGHEEMLAADPEEEIRKSLEKQLYSMQRLNKLIRDLLKIARLEEQDTLKKEPVDLNELITNILEDYATITSARGISVITQLEPLTISADPEKIQRLLINLVDNGIKYNHPLNGRILVRTKKVKGSAVIEVTNDGKTISPTDIQHIFKQFYRIEKSRSQAYGGTGLGLTIALRIVEMHGGSLEVASANEVTTFTVTLPHAALP